MDSCPGRIKDKYIRFQIQVRDYFSDITLDKSAIPYIVYLASRKALSEINADQFPGPVR